MKLKITDIDSLRQHAIDTLLKLEKKQISVEEAGVTGKLCENVVSTIKVQLEYSKMIQQDPNIKFLENCTLPKGRIIEEVKQMKALPDKRKIR